MKVLASAIVLVSFVVLSQCHPVVDGQCPDFQAVENIDGERAAGEWFLLGHGKVGLEADKEHPEKTFKCAKQVITVTPTGFNSTMTAIEGANQEKTKKVIGTKLPGNLAKYSMKHADGMPAKEGVDMSKIQVTLQVINTDYSNILMGVTCISDGTKNGYKFAAYGRAKSYPAGELDKIREVFKQHGITAELVPSDQSC
ncbi:hypothetical protein CHUAL_014149 [Chamberlinius hualienensis]